MAKAGNIRDGCASFGPWPMNGLIVGVNEFMLTVLPPTAPSPDMMRPPSPSAGEAEPGRIVSVWVPITRASVPSETGMLFTVTAGAPGVKVVPPTTISLG